MFTTSFSIKRCLTLARYDLFTRRRTYLLWFLGIYAILTIVNMFTALGYEISDDPNSIIPDVAKWAVFGKSTITMLLLLLTLLAASFDRMSSKAGRTAYLMLPVRRSEKFVTAIVERFLMSMVMLIVAFILADVTRALVLTPTIFYSDLTIDLLAGPNMWRNFFFDTTASGPLLFCMGTALKTEIFVFFVMVGVLFPRFAPVWAWGLFVAVVFVLGITAGILMCILENENDILDITTFEWIVLIQAVVFTVVGLYVSWHRFCHTHVVRRKLF